jgi:hypothetical protein
MAAFCATLAWRSLSFAMRTMREQRKNAAQGSVFKPDAKRSVGGHVAAALFAIAWVAALLVTI